MTINPNAYNIWFSLCGLIIDIIVVVVFMPGRNVNVRRARIFGTLTGFVVFTELLSLSHSIWLNVPQVRDSFSVSFQKVILTAEKLSMMTTTMFMFLYVMEIYRVKYDKPLVKLMIITPQLLTYGFIISAFFTDYFFKYNENGEMVYQYPQGWLVYINAFLFLSYVIYLNINYGHTLNRGKLVVLWCYLAFAAIWGAVKIVFDSTAMYEFFLSLSLMLYVYTLQNPGEYTDPDAGCLNRAGFNYLVRAGFAQEEHFSIGFIHIEELAMFENVEKGTDVFMRTMVTTVQELAGRDSEIFRVRGNVLALKMIGDDEGRVMHIMETVMKRMGEPWKGANGEDIRLVAQASLILCPREISDMRQVLEIADLAANMSRSQSKLILRTPDIDLEGVHKRMRIMEAVKHAMEEHLFEVYYQPIYETRTGRFTSAEALLRLRDPEIGFISPGEFIPVAEQSGMIVQIDRYVLEEVCRLISETEVRSLGLKYVEVNLSVVDCIQSDLSDRVLDLLRKYRVEPSEINLEVTETAEDGITYSMLENIRKLSREGITFSLDDFGTGYSNLKRLTQMPLSLIKLDKSVVQPAFENDYSYKILLGMIRLIRALKRDMVAEGVETEEQAQKLIRLSCDHIQGFFYARPLNRENFVRFLREKN